MENSLDYFEGGIEDCEYATTYPNCKNCFQRGHKDHMSNNGLCKECVSFGIIRKVVTDYDNS